MVHPSPSSQASLFALNTHLPVVASHVSVVHVFLSSQSPSLHLGTQPVIATLLHLPAAQMSMVQASLSSHSLLTLHWGPQPAIAVFLHAPVALSQVSEVQASSSSQDFAACLQAPFSQVSVVHALASLQSKAVMHVSPPHPAIGACSQSPDADAHESVVHASLSSQPFASPPH